MSRFKRCRLLSRLWSSFKKRFGRKPSSRTIAISALVLFLLFLFGIENVRSREQSAPGALRVHAFSVGEANAALIELPDGRTILIDAATEEQGERLAFLLKKQGIGTIDFLIGTHPHADHIGGIPRLLKTFSVHRLLLQDPFSGDRLTQEACRLWGKTPEWLRAGTILIREPQLSLEVLSPSIHSNYEDENSASAVIRLSFEGKTFLFMGDATAQTESDLLDRGESLKADYLLVAHHGSATFSSPEFLSAVAPEIAVISVGRDNSYELPSDAVVSRLNRLPARLYRTDRDGTVTVVCEKNQLRVYREKN